MPRIINPEASGKNYKEAIIIEACDIEQAIEEEYKYLIGKLNKFGKRGKDWQICMGAVDIKNNKIYDIIYVWLSDNKKFNSIRHKDRQCFFSDFFRLFYFFAKIKK
jgi:hypothetical protein